jgi:Protein of unknown function (DUF559)
MSPDQRAATLAATQASALSRAQAHRAGLTDGMINYRRARGRWRLLHPGVYAIAGAPPTWEQALWGAVLAVGPGAVVSHETALLLDGLDDRHVPRHPLTFTVPHGEHHRVRGAVVHQIDDLAPHHVRHVDGLRLSVPARSIVDIAATVGPRRLGDLVDLATDRLTSVARISASMAEVARPGKRGLFRLGAVLDDRGPGYVPPQSELEARLFSALADAGLPAPSRQFPLPSRGAVEGTVDAAYTHVRVIVEADGRRWHTRIRHLRRDHERDAEAARAGWQTLRLLYEQLAESPAEQAEVVADVLAVRSAQLTRPAG